MELWTRYQIVTWANCYMPSFFHKFGLLSLGFSHVKDCLVREPRAQTTVFTNQQTVIVVQCEQYSEVIERCSVMCSKICPGCVWYIVWPFLCFVRNVSQELSETILTMVANCSNVMNKARQPPPGVMPKGRAPSTSSLDAISPVWFCSIRMSALY